MGANISRNTFIQYLVAAAAKIAHASEQIMLLLKFWMSRKLTDPFRLNFNEPKVRLDASAITFSPKTAVSGMKTADAMITAAVSPCMITNTRSSKEALCTNFVLSIVMLSPLSQLLK